MSIEFLRRLAFHGPLEEFFRSDELNFGKRATGISLRFKDDFLYEHNYPDNKEVTNIYAHSRYSDLGYGFRLLSEDTTSKSAKKAIEIIVDYSAGDDWYKSRPNNWRGFKIRYREMGPIEVVFSPGDPILAETNNGTLCGFLADSGQNKLYGLTCGHVADTSNGKVFHRSKNTLQLGRTKHTVVPKDTGNCSMKFQSDAGKVDAALIEIDPSVALVHGGNRTVNPISALDQGDFVNFYGQGSRSIRPAMVWSATIWKKLDLLGNNKLVCCGDVIELAHQTVNYVHSSLAKSGDSGAAVIKSPDNGEWVGMIFGKARGSAFASHAEHIMDWADKKIPGIKTYP